MGTARSAGAATRMSTKTEPIGWLASGVAAGDTLEARWRMTGIHQGALVGPSMTVPATGKRIDLWGMSLYRVEDGMAKEIWESFDVM